MNANILVLISTYNGEKYLEQLLDSVLNQKGVNIDVLVRDDGSSDNTINILKKYKEKNKIEYYIGNNIGYACSFWQLLMDCKQYDYYAFCDQDDIWLEEKMCAAIKMLKGEDNAIPLLYTSRVISINNKLEIVKNNTFGTNGVLDVYESFQRSSVPGCTFVFNNEAIKLLKKYSGYMESHDWATYSIINVFGKVVYDNNSYIYYRIHSNNAIGHDNKIKETTRKIKRLFRKSTHTRSKFAIDFYNIYKDAIPNEYIENIKKLGFYRENLKDKLSLILGKNFKGIIFRIYILLNRV